VLSGRGLCDELITRPEESYRLWCVVVCDLENLMNEEPYAINVIELNKVIHHWMYFLRAINSDCQTRLLNVLGQIAMILGNTKKKSAFACRHRETKKNQFILVINQLDAQKCCFIIRLLYPSTCFEHYVLIIRGQNCIIQHLQSVMIPDDV